MERKTRFEVNLPFAGFYSAHESDCGEIDRFADDYHESTGHDIPESLLNLAYDAADFGSASLAYAKEYAESFLVWLGLTGEFSGMESPRYYNFETDRVFAKIDRASLARLWRGVDRDLFEQRCKDRFTSRDGFISHYSADWRSWGRLSEWDHNQLGTLVLAYAETEQGDEWSFSDEMCLMENAYCNGGFHAEMWQGEKADRFWRLWNYLTYDRPRRAVKTMAQWRVAFAKPFETTPLGAVMQ